MKQRKSRIKISKNSQILVSIKKTTHISNDLPFFQGRFFFQKQSWFSYYFFKIKLKK